MRLQLLLLAGIAVAISGCNPNAQPRKRAEAPEYGALVDRLPASRRAGWEAVALTGQAPPADSIDSPVQTPATLPAPAFGRYRAKLYAGPTAKPKLSPADADTWAFRTRIRDGASGKPSFGGHYALTVFGCGAACIMGFLTDLKTGDTVPLPMWGETHPYLQLTWRADSRLLRAVWRPEFAEPERCRVEDFEVRGMTLRSLGQQTYAGPCPMIAGRQD